MFEFSKSTRPQEATNFDYRSKVFHTLWTHIRHSRIDGVSDKPSKINIMDFGCPLDKNIQFFNQFSCKIYIADLNSDWQLTQSKLPWYLSWTSLLSPNLFLDGNSESLGSDSLIQTLAIDQSRCLDIVICWDLLNYMDELQVQSWYQAIKKFVTKRTLLQALFSTGSTMPASPGKYQILDDHHVRVRFEPGERACPRYNQVQLQKLMPGLVAQKSFLLQNGMQEYLFEFKDE